MDDLSRRHFLASGLAGLTGNVLADTRTSVPVADREVVAARRPSAFVVPLWGTMSVEEARVMLPRAQDAGVTRLIGPWDPVVVEMAHERGIQVHPYVGHTAFPTYGRRRMQYTWSVDYLREPIDSPVTRQKLDHHRPVWTGGATSEPDIDPFALAHPEYWSRTRAGGNTFDYCHRLCLSLAYPEVVEDQLRRFESLFRDARADGFQVEFVWGSENDHGFIDAGYDEPILATYRERTGRDASERAGDDAEWLAFRAEYVTRFLREARARIRAVVPEAVFTTTILAGEPDVYLRSFQDWPAWVDEGIIDEFHLWFRTDDDLEAVARQTRHAADIVSGRVPMVVELSCYHVGSFQEHDPLVEAGRRARANGADAVGVYRHHAVDQLDLWDALAEIGRLP